MKTLAAPRFIVSLTALLSLVSSARAQEKIILGFQPAVGTVYGMEERVSLNSSFQLDGKAMDTVSTFSVQNRLEVMDVADNADVTVKSVLTRVHGRHAEAGKAAVDFDSAKAGETFNLAQVLGPDRKWGVEETRILARTGLPRQPITGAGRADAGLWSFPDRPVSVGDTWTGESNRSMGELGTTQAALTFTLKALEADTATIGMTGELTLLPAPAAPGTDAEAQAKAPRAKLQSGEVSGTLVVNRHNGIVQKGSGGLAFELLIAGDPKSQDPAEAKGTLVTVSVKLEQERLVPPPPPFVALPAAPPVPARATTTATKISPEEAARLKAFGDRLAAQLTAKEIAEANTLVDLVAVEERVFGALPQSEEVLTHRKAFATAMASSGLLGQVAQGPVTCLRAREREGEPTVLLRCLPPTGGAIYTDAVLRREGDSYRVVDLFHYLYSLTSSEGGREGLAGDLKDPAVAAQALGVEEKDVAAVLALRAKVNAGVAKGGLALYHAMSADLQDARPAFVDYLRCLPADLSTQEAQNEYILALEHAPNVLPGAVTPMLALDLHIKNKDWPEAHGVVNETAKIVGGDAFLSVLKGNLHLMADEVDAAAKNAEEAVVFEPTLLPLVDLRLAIHCRRGDFPAIVRELRGIKERFGKVLLAANLTEPQYEAFLKSPEYTAWAAENP